jgi:para-aminobenzoate synthetase component 1
VKQYSLHRNKHTYPLVPGQAEQMKRRMLNWSQQFSILLFLDNNNYPSGYPGYECLLAVEAIEVITGEVDDQLAALQQHHDNNKDWLFGHIAYDYKNVLEPGLASAHDRKIGFPLLHFFRPHTVCYINREQTDFTIETFGEPADVYAAILSQSAEVPLTAAKIALRRAIDKETYLDVIGGLRQLIADGDCYEVNMCNEGYCEDAGIAPLSVFKALSERSPAPFAAYYRLDDKYMMCASPERYLKKEGNVVMSQPIKGTAARAAEPAADESAKHTLQNDIKERAENVMIVDLVRNDLSRCCETGSIRVDELFGIYTFPQVHQMISTVSGTLKADVPFTDAIRYSFPMGSMTGAPKYKVMQLIDQYERSARELFSGTVGYITPSGDFDFNVVIRSLFYNATTKYLSYQTGGAITYDSVPEKEWDELQLKARAIEAIFSGQ